MQTIQTVLQTDTLQINTFIHNELKQRLKKDAFSNNDSLI